MLHPPEDRQQDGDARLCLDVLFTGNRCQTHQCVYFIHRSVGFDAQRILGDALPPGEPGLSRITSASVNPVERQARRRVSLLGSLVFHASILACVTIPHHFVTISLFIGPSAPSSSFFSFLPALNLS